VAPPTLLPPSLVGWPVEVSHDLDAVLPTLDVAYLLRMQQERMTEHLVPSLREYTARFGLTLRRVDALRPDAIVVRHSSAGVPWQIAQWLDGRVSVVNAGDGWHEHPTQALLDSYTIREERGSLDGLHIGIIGDVKHSRVARSDVLAYTALGATVTLVAPPTLLPPSLAGWPVTVSHDIDAVLPTLDVAYLLRMQQERMTEHLVPSLREYTARFGLTLRRVDALRPDALVMHPGPMNRGVEISAEVADLPRSVIIDQVRNGVATRMAVLYLLLGQGVDKVLGADDVTLPELQEVVG
ncbi:MAG: aspartate carbamoyltransferase catalytic subunit, partial [Acidimicrobiales bacterium]